MEFKFLSRNKISQLPKNSGVYCFKNKEILYIGKAANLRERVKNHFQQPTYRDNLFINQASKIGYIKTDSEIEALILEANLIKRYQPKYNVIWRDDKNYFFVAKTIEDFPRIFWTHQPLREVRRTKYEVTKKSSKSSDFRLQTSYVGPFVDGKALKQTLKILRKVFPYRSCKTLPTRKAGTRPCLWYHLGRCLAPCLIKTKLEEKILFEKIKKECQKNAEIVFKILQGKKFQVLENLKREMKETAGIQDFERAAKIRNQIWALEKVLANSKIFQWTENEFAVIKPWQNYHEWRNIIKGLKKIFKIEGKISRIEAYDVSNIQGQLATGAMVTFINGFPDKNFYRKFKIKITGKPNDVAMLKEVLNRRFKHPEWPFPDLILIDGGIAQLNAALKVKNQPRVLIKKSTSGVDYGIKNRIKIISLAKKENKLFIENRKEPILLKTLSREIFNLILQLRDEAHRFAISYHKKLRERGLFKK
jgi:excinuclease ABC subunit C